jgi:hypothetical protein
VLWSRFTGIPLELGVSADDLWTALASETEKVLVCGLQTEILAPPVRALHLALHASQHASDHYPKPVEHLARALEVVSLEVWKSAALLATRLRAVPAFSHGLRILPAGQRLADRLQPPVAVSVKIALRDGPSPALAMELDWLLNLPGFWTKMVHLARKVVPSAAHLKAWSPLANRGRAGLI